MSAADAHAESLSASDAHSDDSAHAERLAAIRQAMPQWAKLSEGFKPAASRNPSLPTLVGLFILILCFFVVLTSISNRQRQREQTVMSSLELTFSGEGMASPSSEAPPEQQAKKMLGDLRSKLFSEVPLVTGETPVTADVLQLDLPRNLVFTGNGAELAPGFTQTLIQAFQALKNGPADFAYEIEIGLSAPTLDDKAVAQGNAIGGALRAAGFANDAAMVSLTPGKNPAIALTIRLRPNERLEPGSTP